MTVLVMKILNVSGIRNGQNPILLGNAVQQSLIYNYIHEEPLVCGAPSMYAPPRLYHSGLSSLWLKAGNGSLSHLTRL